MDPFKITVNLDGQVFDLHIHPEESATYKIIYKGDLVGAITIGNNGDWEAVETTNLTPEIHTPMYEYDGAKDEVMIDLQNGHAQHIGNAISQYSAK
ncbi:hypothetical protein ACSBL2_08020 [Pedobacter sp. AW31-3R]|uniref:hypothetical protein n=1 Tax=Pedobacter sp. AW31-3R TaxID=3445781 RepID=UPI003F9F8DCC